MLPALLGWPTASGVDVGRMAAEVEPSLFQQWQWGTSTGAVCYEHGM